MPPLVAAGIEFLLPALATALGTTGLAVLSYAIVIGAFYAYSSYQARAARAQARDDFNSNVKDRLVMTTTTDNARSRVYGRVRNVDGVLFKNTHGPNNELYTFVVAVAGHEIDGFEDFWFNDTKLTLDADGYARTNPYELFDLNTHTVTSMPTSGDETTFGGGSYATHVRALAEGSIACVQITNSDDGSSRLVDFTLSTDSEFNAVINFTGAIYNVPVTITYQSYDPSSYARIRGYTGAPGQDISTVLTDLGLPDVTPAMKFSGIALMVVTLKYNTTAFVSGIPGMSATVRGAKIYDPRTGITAWSENPALIARDWATYPYGGNASVSELVDSTFIAAANACDVIHNFRVKVGDTGVIFYNVPVYTCGIVCPSKSDPTQFLNEIVTAMAGKYAWNGGQLRIKAGAYQAPSLDMNESWLSGTNSIEIVSGIARIDLVNVYRPTIADQEQGYVLTPTAEIRSAPYIESDGEELPREVTFQAITQTYRAGHVSLVMMRDARQALTIKMPCNMKAYPLDTFDTVRLSLANYGWANKEFEVLTWEFGETDGVVLVMKETAAAIFDMADEFEVNDIAANTSLPLPWFVPQMTGLAASSGTVALDDGSIGTRTLITWDPSTSANVLQSGSVEVQIASVLDGQWQSYMCDGSATQIIVPSLLGGIPYIIRIRGISSAPISVAGSWGTQIVHIIAKPASAIADWTDIPGRPKLFRVLCGGYVATAYPTGVHAGLTDGETNEILAPVNRSYGFARIRRSDAVVTFHQYYDVFSSGASAASALAAALNATDVNSIAVVFTWDEPLANRFAGGLAEALYRCGASRSIFGSPNFQARGAYVLVGIGGCGEGNGFELYAGSFPSDPNAVCDMSFFLKGGNLIVTGTSASPGDLTDYGYNGTMDATTDLFLVARGTCVLAGNYASKLNGATAWDSDVYSKDSASFACYASAVAVSNSTNVMFGLNADPLTDQTYTSLDYALYFAADGNLYAYESGGGIVIGTYVAGDVGLILYDGSNVRYMKNGTTLRTVATTPGRTFFFDSSFYTVGAALRNIRFGALSANDWSSIGGVNVTTAQIAPSAATEVFTDNFSFAGAGYGNLVARSFVVTPTVNCVVEFSATLGARNIDGDSGSGILWRVTPAGGSTIALSATNTTGGTGVRDFPATAAFTAVAGVALTFEILVARGGFAAVYLYDSRMRVTLVKR